MADFVEFLRLLLGSVVHRPYVYAFFACYLVFGVHQLGWRRVIVFTISTYLITYACEYSSTRNGFPFGPYTYIDVTRDQELWISNVPFWDSLSFVFLSYFSFVMAAVILTDGRKLASEGPWPGVLNRATPYLGGIIMMLLDVVIDPVALEGRKWFLGQVYNYPYPGFYFGVTAANFAGWFFVGWMTQKVFQRFLHVRWCQGAWRRTNPLFVWAVYGVYAGVFLFNLAVTIMIGDYDLARASAIVAGATLLALALIIRAKTHGRTRVAAAA